MQTEAATSGNFYHELMQRSYPAISIVTMRDIIEKGARLHLPSHEVHKKGGAVQAKGEQGALEL